MPELEIRGYFGYTSWIIWVLLLKKCVVTLIQDNTSFDPSLELSFQGSNKWVTSYVKVVIQHKRQFY